MIGEVDIPLSSINLDEEGVFHPYTLQCNDYNSGKVLHFYIVTVKLILHVLCNTEWVILRFRVIIGIVMTTSGYKTHY